MVSSKSLDKPVRCEEGN